MFCTMHLSTWGIEESCGFSQYFYQGNEWGPAPFVTLLRVRRKPASHKLASLVREAPSPTTALVNLFPHILRTQASCGTWTTMLDEAPTDTRTQHHTRSPSSPPREHVGARCCRVSARLKPLLERRPVWSPQYHRWGEEAEEDERTF